MALVPPTFEDLNKFRGEDEFAEDERDRVELVLTQATDALWAYTGIENAPADERKARILENAIFDLTLWLMSQSEHRDEINSPFSSERIGSYSYSKMQQAESKAGGSGLFWLDMLFRSMLGAGDALGGSWTTSEDVFNPYGLTYEQQRQVEKNEVLYGDPSEPWGFRIV